MPKDEIPGSTGGAQGSVHKLPSYHGSLRPALLMFGGVISISTMHALVRYASAEIHPFEIAFFRNLVPLALMVPLVKRAGPAAWRTTRPALQAIRGCLGVSGMLIWFVGLALVPVADATALNFISVILITIFAALFLRERVGIRRWSAVVLGFVGMLIILRPGFATINLGAVLVLLSSVFWATTFIMMKILAKTDAPVTIVFYGALYMAPLSLMPALFVWTWPTLYQLAVLCSIGALATLAHLAMTQALSETDASVLMPLDFTRLIWAAALGYLMFGEFPDLWTWIGGILIAASAAYIVVREQKRRKEMGSEIEPHPVPPIEPRP